MISRRVLPLLVLLALVAVWPLAATAAGRHSGVVVAVDAATDRLVVHEMLEGTRTRDLPVRVGPDTAVVLSELLPDDQVTDLLHPFRDVRIALADVHPGDFVTVDVAAPGRTARAVTVTLRSGAR